MVTDEQQRLFRRALQRARRDQSLSQRALASALGVSPSAVSQWESGETSPRPEMASKLEAVLDLTDGALTRLLGYLPSGVKSEAVAGVLDAIEADPRLTDEQRDLMRELYRQLVGDQSDDAAIQ